MSIQVRLRFGARAIPGSPVAPTLTTTTTTTITGTHRTGSL
jgi:hypothetical protein